MKSAIKARDWFENREKARQEFLQKFHWEQSYITPIGEDCAFRRYFRLKRDQETIILMEAIPDHSDIATPGHNMLDFVRIGVYLRSIGLMAPTVYEMDEQKGYILLEDFGNSSFKQEALNALDRNEVYELATDVLVHLQKQYVTKSLSLPDYYDSHVHIGRRRVVDWYIPCVTLEKNSESLVSEYLGVWKQIEEGLPECPKGFLHVDYHFENLMWLKHNKGMNRCGVLDFQGAMYGPSPYDLANLLEDARIDVPTWLRVKMIERYCRDMSEEEKDVFTAWYRVLATQFHCRVIGQFIRLALRDGKKRYLSYIPRISGYIREGLNDPVLFPLKSWFKGQSIDFTEVLDLDTPKVLLAIREDAF